MSPPAKLQYPHTLWALAHKGQDHLQTLRKKKRKEDCEYLQNEIGYWNLVKILDWPYSLRDFRHNLVEGTSCIEKPFCFSFKKHSYCNLEANSFCYALLVAQNEIFIFYTTTNLPNIQYQVSAIWTYRLLHSWLNADIKANMLIFLFLNT